MTSPNEMRQQSSPDAGFGVGNEPTHQQIADVELRRQAIARALGNPEKADSYSRLLAHLTSILPANEAQQLAEDPLMFVSKKYLFRGMSVDALRHAEECGFYEPQPGEMWGIAVYTSNSPYAAFSHNKGAVVVLDKGKLKYASKDGIVDVGSDLYQVGNAQYLEGLPPREAKDAVYTMDNRWDISRQAPGGNPNARIVELRNPQPFTATRAKLYI